MKKTAAFLLCAIFSMSSVASADVTLSPTDIHNGDTNTTSFSDGFLTLTPQVSGAPSTFNGNATRLGNDDVGGTNPNSFNDIDTDPNNGNEEQLLFEFVPTAGLSQISYDFSRADGPGAADGVIISGFLADPNATFSVSDPNLFAVYDGSGTVRLNIPGSLFNGNEVFIDFDSTASAGQTLLMNVTDTTQAGAQFAIRSISYNPQAIPEPAAASFLLLGLGCVVARRRRR